MVDNDSHRQDVDRELWDPTVQAIESDDLTRRVEAGLQDAWTRVWDEPIGFYRARYEAAGLGRDDMPALDLIPRTTKGDLRADEATHEPFGTHRSVGLDRAARIGVTTGTTGKPWMTFYSAADLERMVATQLQHTWRAGLRAGHRFAHSWPGGLYPSAVLGGRHLLDLGVLEIPCGPPFSQQQAADHVLLWQTLGIDALMTTGSQLQIYDDAAASVGVDLVDVLRGASLIFVEASCQFDEPRARVESTYGVRLHNLSGAGEIPGFVTSDCRFHTGLHVPPIGYVVQVCDPATGQTVPPGERGTLVVSTWGLDAFFLRYDIEDIVVASSGTCPCGQTGPRYTLIGRAADAAYVGDHMLLPLDVQLALEEHGAPEFVLAPGRHDTLRLRVELTGDVEAVRQSLGTRLGVPIEVEAVDQGTLPRSTFKPRRIAA
jgi:phenylacetate-CoA ligase